MLRLRLVFALSARNLPRYKVSSNHSKVSSEVSLHCSARNQSLTSFCRETSGLS